MQPQFSAITTEKPIRTDDDGRGLMPEWSDGPDGKPLPPQQAKTKTSPRMKTEPVKEPRKRVARDLQPDATQMDSVTQAKQWLEEHPEEAEMLRTAQAESGDILADAGVPMRFYSSTEAAAFFDKTVQWLYWGMRHPPHGGRLFQQVVYDAQGEPKRDPETGDVVTEDIPVPRLNGPVSKRRFDIPTIRKFAISAYHRGNIKEPKLRAVLERLVVAERGGVWMSIPMPKRKEDEDAEPGPN